MAFEVGGQHVWNHAVGDKVIVLHRKCARIALPEGHFIAFLAHENILPIVPYLDAVLVSPETVVDVYGDRASCIGLQAPLAHLRVRPVSSIRHNFPLQLTQNPIVLIAARAGCCEGVEVQGVIGVDARRRRVLGHLVEPRQADCVELVNEAVEFDEGLPRAEICV